MTDSGVIAAEVRRLRAGDEELADAGERDADHADPTGGPRLRGDRLDGVVAVERLQVLEEVVRAAGAAGAAHVHADPRHAERGRHELVLRLAGARARRVVAGVLDDGRVRALVRGAGQDDIDRERRAVTGRQVPVAIGRGDVVGDELLARVERLRRHLVGVEDPDRDVTGVADHGWRRCSRCRHRGCGRGSHRGRRSRPSRPSVPLRRSSNGVAAGAPMTWT